MQPRTDRQTDTHTDARDRAPYISCRLLLARNVVSKVVNFESATSVTFSLANNAVELVCYASGVMRITAIKRDQYLTMIVPVVMS